METAHPTEIAHILAGPVLGVIITVLAFTDEYFIKRKARAFFKDRKVAKDLAGSIEAMISGGIALATFLGNLYLFLANCALALTIFPTEDLKIAAIISIVLGIFGILQTVYIFWNYGLLDIGEICPAGQITYDRVLRWEQVVLNIVMTCYFAFGISLKYGFIKA